MKKIIFTLLTTLVVHAVSAQSLLNKVKSTAESTQNSTNGILAASAKDIMAKLGPTLALSAIQKPKVLEAVSSFATQKAQILPLLNTDKAAYASKLTGLQNTLFPKLKSILTVAQYSKFLGLKPKAPSATDALSALFF
ncbi:hypothetical protein [Pedobacter glucosidilyticus]|uniref:hypothetical protein n=1 Tax=Pedobacter glucosidilyticus TaxID=1122941 RepID=UPI0003F5B4FC|nr:hypothetical protein [Pedobacter glucosidilyticus]